MQSYFRMAAAMVAIAIWLIVSAVAADEPRQRIWGEPSGKDGLIIPNGFLQKRQLEIAKELPELTALDIACWDFQEGLSFASQQLLQGFSRTEGGCTVYAGFGTPEPDATEAGMGLRCFSHTGKELHCQLIGDIAVPMRFTCIYDPTPLPIGNYWAIPPEVANREDVLRYYRHMWPDEYAEVQREEMEEGGMGVLFKLQELAGEGSDAWFTDMVAVVVYPTDEDGYTGVEILSGEPLWYYLDSLLQAE